MEYRSIEALRRTHAGWRLLAADRAPLIISFLHETFIVPNVRTIVEGDLITRLEEYLTEVREKKGADEFPRDARAYLDEWASDRHGWLRKYFPPHSDEPHFDLTPATERAIEWVSALRVRAFVGTESRLLTVVMLLREIAEGTTGDAKRRLFELEKRRKAVEDEIARVREGFVDVLDPTKIKDRFQQAEHLARGLLADFREVEQNFRELDRAVRERIAAWDGGRGALLDEIFGQRDLITSSDQGRSFAAFWDFLMSEERQDELSELLEAVMSLDAVKELAPDPRLRRIHHDWLAAGYQAQRTVAYLSDQLRRLVDDRAFLENRRIMQLLRSIEQHALALRADPPDGFIAELDDLSPMVTLALERPLYAPPFTSRFESMVVVDGTADGPTDALYEYMFVDKDRLHAQVRRLLQTRDQVSLAEVVTLHPLEQGLAELVMYLVIASEVGHASIDEANHDTISWRDDAGAARTATVPRVIFAREAGGR